MKSISNISMFMNTFNWDDLRKMEIWLAAPFKRTQVKWWQKVQEPNEKIRQEQIDNLRKDERQTHKDLSYQPTTRCTHTYRNSLINDELETHPNNCIKVENNLKGLIVEKPTFETKSNEAKLAREPTMTICRKPMGCKQINRS